jgi:hypothetical protein
MTSAMRAGSRCAAVKKVPPHASVSRQGWVAALAPAHGPSEPYEDARVVERRRLAHHLVTDTDAQHLSESKIAPSVPEPTRSLSS